MSLVTSATSNAFHFDQKPRKYKKDAPASDRVVGRYEKKKTEGRRAAVVRIPKSDAKSYSRSSRTVNAIISKVPNSDTASLFNKVRGSVNASQIGLAPLVNKMITCINTHDKVLEGIQKIKSREGPIKYVLRSLQGLKFTEIDMLNFSFIEANNDSENHAKSGIKEKIFFFKSDIAQWNSSFRISHRVKNAPSLSALSSSTINGTNVMTNTPTTSENPFLLEYFFDEDNEFNTVPYYGIGEDEYLFLRKRECANSFFADEYIVDEKCNLLYVRCVVNEEVATYKGEQLELFRVTFTTTGIKVKMIQEIELKKVKNAAAKSAYNKFRNTYLAIFSNTETDGDKVFSEALLDKFIKRLVYPSAKNVVKRFITAALHHIRGGTTHRLGNEKLSFDDISDTTDYEDVKTDDFEFKINHDLITKDLGKEESAPALNWGESIEDDE